MPESIYKCIPAKAKSRNLWAMLGSFQPFFNEEDYSVGRTGHIMAFIILPITCQPIRFSKTALASPHWEMCCSHYPSSPPSPIAPSPSFPVASRARAEGERMQACPGAVRLPLRKELFACSYILLSPSAIIWRDCAVYMSENVKIQGVYEGGVFKPLQDTNRIFDEALSIALETGSRAADSFYKSSSKG
jgi:hypothetical protein